MEIEISKEFSTPLKKIKYAKELTLTDKSKVYLQMKEGKRLSDIAKSIRKSPSTIREFLNKSQIKRTMEPQHKLKGRYAKGYTKLTDRQKKLITRWLNNEEITSSQDAYLRLQRIKNAPRVCYNTVRVFLSSLGKWRLPRLKTILSAANRKKRLDHCKEFLNFDFKKVLFTDESCFQLNANTLKVFVGKGKEVPTKPKYNPNISQMVWGGISFFDKTPICFMDGWINATKYQELLIEQKNNIRSIFKKDRRIKTKVVQRPGVNNWYFLQDNAKVHTTQTSIECIKKHLTNKIFPHPPQSPDLNPLELVWAEMKKQVQLQRPKNKRQLREAIEICWKRISIKYVRKCIAGLKKRMEKIIECEGDRK